ncbi:uncharacterized protein LOC123321470 [Coccinella septempunctata]|uniref:uncharacterized protein LOC123321470 n=1 Tax=Coccinella septempunctata TaxID=41139 RepID=UPI001D063639|nr:uncharacterized protein LOC123321470 [Coccinella septempunctata]
MNDEELTRLAVAQLIAEAEKFKRRHELRYKLDGPSRLRPNLRYFNNTIKNCVSSNERKDQIRKSRAAAELKCLDNSVKIMKKDENIEKTSNNGLQRRNYSAEQEYATSTCKEYVANRKTDNNSKKESMKKIIKNKSIVKKKLAS